MHWLRRLQGRAPSVLRRGLTFWMGRPALLVAVVALVVTGASLATVRTLSWMETPNFCSQCHTMRAEVAAHERSPHQTVECTECHTGRGIAGFFDAKWDGMHQLLKIISGSYARPIPPAAHGMPPTDETCLRCHNPERQRGELLITRSYFLEDRDNTEQRMALVMRLDDDGEERTKGIHWHVLSTVEFLTRDEEGQVVDWIGVQNPDGTSEQFISRETVEISDQAGLVAEELLARGEVRRMTCYDCHNRVGHAFPTPARAIDDAMAAGQIDPGLPYLKKRALEVIGVEHETLAEADQAILELRSWYHNTYPNLSLDMPDRLQSSFVALAQIYRQSANPEMGAFPESYPSYLGHTDSAGCFRCHDSGHYKIVDGALSDEPIPSRCSLCHTFPTVGKQAPNVMLGPAPGSHSDRLWVFSHKNEAGSLSLEGTSCSGCHSQTYCSNCHATGAQAVGHEDMYFDHAAVIKETTTQPCSYCHQKPFCDRCHEEGDYSWSD